MKKTSSVSRIVVIGAAVAIVLGGLSSVRPAAAKESLANDCLVGLQGPGASPDVSVNISAVTVSCTDGDSCDADGATNGSCSFKVRGCVDIPDVSGCTTRPIKKVKFSTKPEKNLIQLVPNSTSPSGAFVCSDFIDFKVGLKKKGKKPGKRKIIASAKANVKPYGKNSDTDKVTFVCNPCPSDSCVPATTTTTTTTTSSSTVPPTLPVPLCGNGTIDGSETCDGSAATNGCSGGTPYCNTTCTGCQASCSQLAFTLGAPTLDCGFPGLGAGASAPLSGQLLDGMDQPVTGGDLGLGCLYIGGGLAQIVPPGPTPNGSTTVLSIADCSVNNPTLSPADTGNPRTCTLGPKASKHCVNGHPGTDGQGTCSQDSDCQPVCVNDSGTECAGDPETCHCVDGAPGLPGGDLGTCSIHTACIDTQGKCAGGACGTCSGDAGTACGCDFDCDGRCKTNGHCGVSSAGGSATSVCLPDPSCYFGSPLPINNSGTSTCVLNTIADGAGGTADVSGGGANLTLPLKSWTYLTGVDSTFAGGDACPICDSGVCNAGPRKGLPCTTNSTLKTTQDCPPPPYLFLAPLGVTLSPLSTGANSKTADASGIFCPGAQATGGAFGVADARKIVQNGSPAAGGLDLTPKDATLGSVFCIPATNNVLIDNSANLPGPGSTALGGTVSLR